MDLPIKDYIDFEDDVVVVKDHDFVVYMVVDSVYDSEKVKRKIDLVYVLDDDNQVIDKKDGS